LKPDEDSFYDLLLLDWRRVISIADHHCHLLLAITPGLLELRHRTWTLRALHPWSFVVKLISTLQLY
jgi:hypothetical protein